MKNKLFLFIALVSAAPNAFALDCITCYVAQGLFRCVSAGGASNPSSAPSGYVVTPSGPAFFWNCEDGTITDEFETLYQNPEELLLVKSENNDVNGGDNSSSDDSSSDDSSSDDSSSDDSSSDDSSSDDSSSDDSSSDEDNTEEVEAKLEVEGESLAEIFFANFIASMGKIAWLILPPAAPA